MIIDLISAKHLHEASKHVTNTEVEPSVAEQVHYDVSGGNGNQVISFRQHLAIDDSSYRLNRDLSKKNEIHPAKSVKCCKMRTI